MSTAVFVWALGTDIDLASKNALDVVTKRIAERAGRVGGDISSGMFKSSLYTDGKLDYSKIELEYMPSYNLAGYRSLMKQYYEAGKSGASIDSVQNSGDVKLADEAKQAAYEAGKAADANRALEKSKNNDILITERRKRYASHRPWMPKKVICDVWERAKSRGNGKVFDPSGVEIAWDITQNRRGQWDMGHIPGQKYSDMHKLYMENKISEEQFVAWYQNPDNYRPELPSTNRSHKYE